MTGPTIVFDATAVADVRTLLERHFGSLPKTEVIEFLRDLYNEGYVLANFTEV